MELKTYSRDLFQATQTEICAALESADGKAAFLNDFWERADSGGGHGGGGLTRVMENGAVFEKAGVNFSQVQGQLPAAMSKKLVNREEPSAFFAVGVSLVLHPYSPMIPTVHANFRFLEVAELRWFGGGCDLTPYYIFDEDCRHFHATLKAECERHSPSYYPEFKRCCDEYFFLPHRQETRGIGGIFFDYLGKEDAQSLEKIAAFVKDVAQAFIPAYLPIVQRRRSEPWGEREKKFQLLRRGRYVEFNLLYDRGTQFGLQTGGRSESILMSLPSQVEWHYNPQISAGSREAELVEVLRQPRQWA